MRKAIDMIGKKYGRLTVIARAPNKSKDNAAYWECVCACGNHTTVRGATLRQGQTLSCGCYQRDRMAQMGHFSAIDLTGQRSGKLVALRSLGEGKNRKVIWECQCDCGNTTTVQTQLFREKRVQSCGCLNHMPITGSVSLSHGHARRGKITRTYMTWQNMFQRCNNPLNPNFPDYGGRGITICERWQIFENFLADMGIRPPKLSIDRINNNGNYEPGNCKWSTQREQVLNTRRSHWITFENQTLRFSEWAKILGISKISLYRRLNRWTLEKALTVPKHGTVPPPPHPVMKCPVCGKCVKSRPDGNPYWHRHGHNSVCEGYTLANDIQSHVDALQAQQCAV